MSDAVDPDEPGTWPAGLRAVIAQVVDGVKPGSYVDELDIGFDDDYVLELFQGRPLRAYHATRLLPHEVDSVKRDGLRRLTEDHIERRIAGAVDVGAIDSEAAGFLLAHTVFVKKHAVENRKDQVCAIAGSNVFTEHPSGVRLLLSTWGGEGIYWCVGDEMEARLRTLGRPSIVVLDLPLDGAQWLMFPGLGAVLAACLGRLDSPGADVHYKGAVPASAVVDVWQPGMPGYDQFDRLPR